MINPGDWERGTKKEEKQHSISRNASRSSVACSLSHPFHRVQCTLAGLCHHTFIFFTVCYEYHSSTKCREPVDFGGCTFHLHFISKLWALCLHIREYMHITRNYKAEELNIKTWFTRILLGKTSTHTWPSPRVSHKRLLISDSGFIRTQNILAHPKSHMAIQNAWALFFIVFPRSLWCSTIWFAKKYCKSLFIQKHIELKCNN